MTPTARTLELLRTEGFTACVVERWNAFSKIRQDAFGFGDLLALHPETGAYKGVWLVQTTSGSHHANRRAKAQALPALASWLAAGGRFAVVSWAKRGPKGARKTWVPRFEEVMPETPGSAPNA